MITINVAQVGYFEDGKAIWVFDKEGSTVLRIQCTGRIKIYKGCTNICPHSDINVVGDIEICVPALRPKSRTKPQAKS